MSGGVIAGSAVERILAGLTERREQIIGVWMDAMVPGYAQREDRERFADLDEGSRRVFDVLASTMCEGRRVARHDLVFLRPYVRKAVLRGASEAEILRSPRVLQRVIWNAVVDAAGEGEDGGAAALALAGPLMDYVEASSQVVGEAFYEAQRALSERACDARRDLLETLLAGRAPEPGPQLNAARACGLGDEAEICVIVAAPIDALRDDAALPQAATTLARATGDALEPLAVVRGEEVVIVRATAAADASRLAGALEEARVTLSRHEIRLSVAVSAVHEARGHVPAAYEEACLALETIRDRGATLALPALSSLDYLIMRGADLTAWRLVPPRIRSFIEEDTSHAGLLIETLMAYVECDLNVKVAAEKLYVHANTARYRLAKVEERTGCNLRRLDDLQQLVVGIRLARSMAA